MTYKDPGPKFWQDCETYRAKYNQHMESDQGKAEAYARACADTRKEVAARLRALDVDIDALIEELEAP